MRGEETDLAVEAGAAVLFAVRVQVAGLALVRLHDLFEMSDLYSKKPRNRVRTPLPQVQYSMTLFRSVARGPQTPPR